MKSDNDENVIKLSSSPDSLLFSSPFLIFNYSIHTDALPCREEEKRKRRMREENQTEIVLVLLSKCLDVNTHTRLGFALSHSQSPFLLAGLLALLMTRRRDCFFFIFFLLLRFFWFAVQFTQSSHTASLACIAQISFA